MSWIRDMLLHKSYANGYSANIVHINVYRFKDCRTPGGWPGWAGGGAGTTLVQVRL